MKALVVDDCIDTRLKVKSALSPYVVFEAENLSCARGILKDTPDLDIIILDVGLPDGSGIDFCEELAISSVLERTPLLIISGHDQLGDRLAGLHAGADDYLTKPFHSSELRARVEAVLRRYSPKNDDIRIDEFVIEPSKLKVTKIVGGQSQELVLTPTEFKLFYTLIRHPEQVFTREELVKHIWSIGISIESRGIDSHICHLRSKLGSDGSKVQSVYGKGYKYASKHD